MGPVDLGKGDDRGDPCQPNREADCGLVAYPKGRGSVALSDSPNQPSLCPTTATLCCARADHAGRNDREKLT